MSELSGWKGVAVTGLNTGLVFIMLTPFLSFISHLGMQLNEEGLGLPHRHQRHHRHQPIAINPGDQASQRDSLGRIPLLGIY